MVALCVLFFARVGPLFNMHCRTRTKYQNQGKLSSSRTRIQVIYKTGSILVILLVDEGLKQIGIGFLAFSAGVALRFVRTSYADYHFRYIAKPDPLSEVPPGAAGLC